MNSIEYGHGAIDHDRGYQKDMYLRVDVDPEFEVAKLVT